ncbi:MAG: hypothetical protein JRJ66_14965 [Deltaproteobacteria bacterium]|nr:hypothetical protein [Deltaproteobacteria bacterium]
MTKKLAPGQVPSPVPFSLLVPAKVLMLHYSVSVQHRSKYTLRCPGVSYVSIPDTALHCTPKGFEEHKPGIGIFKFPSLRDAL